MAVLRQTSTLVYKDLLIVAVRRWLSTALRAVLLPIVYMWFISYVRNFFMPPSVYGFGDASPIRSLPEVFNGSVDLGGRNRIALVNNGFTGGQIENVITALSSELSETSVEMRVLDSEENLFSACQSSLRGLSRCYAAVSFHSSPSEGPGGQWNYTAISDFMLGQQVYVDQNNNDAQIFALPFIHAVNSAIASESGTSLPDTIFEQPFTSETVQDRDDQIQRFFMRALVNYLGVVFFIGICGVAYHLPGNLASERESGMSQLIDAMVPHRSQWITQMIRLFAKHVAFDLVYLPGWISIGAIVSALVFENTSSAIIIPFHMLTGFALTGYSIFGGTLFRRAQLSGITVLIISLVLAVVAQFIINSRIVTVVLSAIFPSVNYTLFIIYLASWERFLRPANLQTAAPGSGQSSMSGSLFFILMAVQVVYYPILAVLTEHFIHGASSKRRCAKWPDGILSGSVEVENVSKHYLPPWWKRPRTVFKAVDNLSFTASQGQIVVLLGANGSGKSTTLSAIAGIHSVTEGTINLDGRGGLGYCPQKNVLWEDLTVMEHVRIFNLLKSQGKTDTRQLLSDLIDSCDLNAKTKKKSTTLSGGQKRKLQLAMAFTGGSQVCCVDEVSSGLDPLSRRKIWEILLAEKGKRTVLLATHALDEADALSDSIVMLSKGSLRAYGSAVELKNEFGNGYRIAVNETFANSIERDQGLLAHSHSTTAAGTVFEARNATEARKIVSLLEAKDIHDYHVEAPTVEDTFLNLADEAKEDPIQVGPAELEKDPRSSNEMSPQGRALPSDTTVADENNDTKFDLVKGDGTSFFQQVYIIFRKRVRVTSRNFLPYCCAILVSLLTAGLATFFLAGFDGLTCTLGANANNPRIATLPVLDYWWGLNIPVGPATSVDPARLTQTYGEFVDRMYPVNSEPEFQAYIRNHFRSVVPGGFYFGYNNTGAPLMAYKANDGIQYAALAKAALDSYLMNANIVTMVSTFALPLASSTGDSLQLVLYFTFAMCAGSGFFALYPAFERLSKVRALHYSNGVRAAPLWLANFIFDGLFGLLISVAAISIFVGLSDLWFEPQYLFVVFLLYSLASVLLSYIVSLFVTSQLAAFAFSAGGQAIFALVYFILYMVLITYSQPDRLFRDLNTVQFTLGLVTPSGNLLRAMLLTLNQSQLLCREQSYVSYAGDIEVYGAPIMYLVLQIVAFYAFLVWYDSGGRLPLSGLLARRRRRGRNDVDAEKGRVGRPLTEEVLAEMARTQKSEDDGLRVLHLTKTFGRETVLEDVTFGVRHGEVFALLGPNGAGKSTTISLIRGDFKPSSGDSDVIVEGASIRGQRRAARQNLGVCPQFDAMDRMSVTEHLRFYARIRGVRGDVAHNVDRVIDAVGLAPFRHRLAAKLSGGNQRKLSLGIALIGNPSILLLDEPSSGMDAVAKRVMWKVLAAVKRDRGLVITTHSMEEASALSDRVGILARRMLALGTTPSLRRAYGDVYHVHLVHERGARITDAEARRILDWVAREIPGAGTGSASGGSSNHRVTMLHGQFRFVVPKTTMRSKDQGAGVEERPNVAGEEGQIFDRPNPGQREVNTAGLLLERLERDKQDLGIKYYTFSEATLEDVFLNVVGEQGVVEDD